MTFIKTQTALRIEDGLLKLIKEKARRERRSLNNYIENPLYNDIENAPNELTRKVIEDARNGKNLNNIDALEDFKSLNVSI